MAEMVAGCEPGGVEGGDEEDGVNDKGIFSDEP